MPTKPATTYTFATSLNYAAGPFIGSATKTLPGDIPNGFVPGTGIVAEWNNYMFHWSGTWITDWVDQGSFLADLDAHIIETNASGETNIASMQIGGTTSGSFAMRLVENSGAPSATLVATNTSGNDCLNATTVGGTGNAVEATCSGTGAAIKVTNSGTGEGMLVDSFANEGLRVTGGGGFTGTVSTGGATGGTGVTGIGMAAGYGVTGVAGPTGAGMWALGIATSTEPALKVWGSLVPLAQVRGTLEMQPTSVPSAPIDGDFWKRPGTINVERGGLEWQDPAGGADGTSAGKQRAHSTTNGFGYGYSHSLGDTTEDGTSTKDKVTLYLGTAAAKYTQPDGYYIVEYSATVRLGAAAAVGTRASVTFIYPGGGSVNTRIDFSAVSERKPVSFFIRHLLTNPGGPDTFKIQIASDGGAPGPGVEVIIDNARIVARGAYEA
jgi:hypothetical protein